MKKGFLLLTATIVLSLLISSCVFESGPISTKSYDYSEFDSVEISSAFQAEVVQSNAWSVDVTAPEKSFDHINVTVDGRTLKISLKNRISWHYVKPKAKITMPELSALTISGASSVSVSGFSSNHGTDVFVSGASKLNLDIKAYTTQMEVSGASRVNGQLNISDFNLQVNGASTAELSGSSNSVTIQASGASHVNMENFVSTNASVDVSGASRAAISTSGKMSVSLSGASSLYYYGNPQLESVDISGSSTMHQK